MTSPVDEQAILAALHEVPRERWGDVLRFIESQRTDGPTGGDPPIRTLGDILESGMVGLWADRDDITDSREFARKLRHEASHRRHDRDAP